MMQITKYVRYIWKIIRCPKKLYAQPKRSPVLIFDNSGSHLFLKYFNQEDVDILYVRNEQINLYVLIKTIFSGKLNSLAYFNQYIKYVKPKVVLTFIDNNNFFYKLKNNYDSAKYIVVQNSIRDGGSNEYAINNPSECTDFLADFSFCFNREVGSRYSRSLKCQSIVIGSFKNNIINKFDNKIKDFKRLIFISQYRETDKYSNLMYTTIDGNKILKQDFYAPDEILIAKLKDFCKLNNLELAIAGSTFSEKGNEYKFYQNVLGDEGWNFFPRTKDIFSSYYQVFSSKYIVCLESTLGYEALTRGKRVAFFPCRKKFIDAKGRNFDAAFESKGEFWTDDISQDEFDRVMKNITETNDNAWQKILNKHLTKIIEYDSGNRKFIKLMIELNVPLKDKYYNKNKMEE